MVRVFPTMIRKAITPKQVVQKGLHLLIYNYPPKERCIVVDIYRDAKRRGIYIHHFSPTLRGIVVLVFTKSDG